MAKKSPNQGSFFFANHTYAFIETYIWRYWYGYLQVYIFRSVQGRRYADY